MRSSNRLHLVLVAALTLMLVACAGGLAPNLERLYSMQAGNPDQPPVVLVHGALGSRLSRSDTAKEIWPGSLRRILFSDYRALRMEIDPDALVPMSQSIQPSGIAARAGGIDFYGRILETLHKAGGYEPGVPGTPATKGVKRYYVFVYDWRQDNVQSARELHAFIQRIKKDYDDPDLKVDIVAHSMGGLVTRYYARYGTEDVLDDNEFPVNREGEEHIRRVVLLGTPSLGSVGALRTLARGYKVGFGVIPPEVVATFPSTYQVLPHAITEWFVTAAGDPIKRDHFSASEFWQRFGFSVYGADVEKNVRDAYGNEAEAYLQTLHRYFEKHIERARRFSWSLTVPVPESALRYIVFGGDCVPTPARAVVEEIDNESLLRLWPKAISQPVAGVAYDPLMFEPGDGTVTKASLLARHTSDPTVARHEYSYFPVDYPVFLCEKHSQLTGNLDFQNNLLHALLSVDR